MAKPKTVELTNSLEFEEKKAISKGFKRPLFASMICQIYSQLILYQPFGISLNAAGWLADTGLV